MMKSVSVAGSTAGVIQVDPPPRFQASGSFAKSAFSLSRSRLSFSPSGVVGLHVPSQPVSGIVQNRHTRLPRSEEHTSELQSHSDLVCRLLLEKKKHENFITV